MFYYYGRKKQIAKHYPKPNYDIIIEPFAGAAAYSLFQDNWKKQVILIEKDKRVADIWKWLIEDATIAKIKKMPDLKTGQHSTEFLHIIHAATKMAFKYKKIKVTPVLERNWEISKRVFVENLHKIKHWKIINGDYSLSPELDATWFIDPPYKGEPGMGYACSSNQIDYNALAQWALKRKGEVIFCEGMNGDYMPFSHLLTLPGVAGKLSQEKIYYRTSAANKNQKDPQLTLF
jgi:site-specific DNA-adenine methylase